jgi:hypothetical protein
MAISKSQVQLVAGLFVLACALLMIILNLHDWLVEGAKLKLANAIVLLSLGTIILAMRRRKLASQDKS